MKTYRRVLGIVLISALAGLVADCGGGNTTADVDARNNAAATALVSISPGVAAVLTNQTIQFTATVGGSSSTSLIWSVDSVVGGNSSVGTIGSTGLYTAPNSGSAQVVTVGATSEANSTESASASVTVMPPGQVTPTNNLQVARYPITTPRAATVAVDFGPDTSYGLKTSSRSTPSGGGLVSILVAGMRASATYHMRAAVRFPDGTQLTDIDHTFTTGGLPAPRVPSVTVAESSGLTPNRGIELLDLLSNASGSGASNQVQVAAVDLQGNLIWYYDPPAPAGLVPNPVKLLPDGGVLVNFSNATGGGDGANSILQEIDLAGNLVWQLTVADLNQRLAAAGFSLAVIGTHHDAVALPDGHLVVIVGINKDFADLPGYPGTTTVTGDGLIDLDSNHNPVWVWNAFDHLDVNRHPMNFPDWTHTNAVIYSPEDGNLIVSMRHQNWILKIDYEGGKGSGDILWRLGQGGDFALLGGTDPMDWFYAQHAPLILGSEARGVFKMGIFDNENDQIADSSGDRCGSSGFVCLSRVPIFQIDENAKTATLDWRDDLPFFSNFGGYVQQLSDQNIEFDAAASSTNPPAATIEEVTQDVSPQVLLQMTVNGQYAYRAFRVSSLYPGVQW